jgi:predicted PurR-regulated permease PerM
VQHNSLTSVALLAAGLAIVLGATHVAGPIVTPILLALVLALIFGPLYDWLRSRRPRRVLGALPALVILLVGLVVAGGTLVLVVGYSMSGVAERLAFHSDRLSTELRNLDAWFASYGLTDMNLAGALTPDRISGVSGAFVGGMVFALYQALLILLMLLFFLADRPAIADRGRRSLSADDPNPDRMLALAHDIGQYFVLRAAVNAVTGAGVTLVLWTPGRGLSTPVGRADLFPELHPVHRHVPGQCAERPAGLG